MGRGAGIGDASASPRSRQLLFGDVSQRRGRVTGNEEIRLPEQDAPPVETAPAWKGVPRKQVLAWMTDWDRRPPGGLTELRATATMFEMASEDMQFTVREDRGGVTVSYVTDKGRAAPYEHRDAVKELVEQALAMGDAQIGSTDEIIKIEKLFGRKRYKLRGFSYKRGFGGDPETTNELVIPEAGLQALVAWLRLPRS